MLKNFAIVYNVHYSQLHSNPPNVLNLESLTVSNIAKFKKKLIYLSSTLSLSLSLSLNIYICAYIWGL